MKIDYDILFEISNSSGDALQVADESGRLVYINEEASRRLGISKDEASNYYVPDFEKIFGDRNSVEWQAHVQELREKKVLKIDGVNINRQTGHKFPVEVLASFKELNGKGYVIAASRDISERAGLYSEITNQQNTITTLYDTFQKFMTSSNYRKEADLGLDRVVDYLNFDVVSIYFFSTKKNTFVKDYQYNRYGENFPDIVPPSTINFDEIYDIYKKIKDGKPILLKSCDNLTDKIQLKISSDRICYFLPLIDNSNFIGFVRIDETIAEDGYYVNRLDKYKNYTRIINSSMSLQKHKLDLAKNNKLFTNLYESIDDVFFIFDVIKNQYNFISPSCEKVFGLKQELFYEKEIFNNKYVVEEDRVLFGNGCEILKEKEFTSFEYRIRHSNGELKHILKKMYPIRNKNGKLIEVSGLCMDITVKKKNEEQLKISTNIIQSKNTELEQKNKKIEELLNKQETDLYLKTIKLSNINAVLNRTKSDLDSLLLEYGTSGQKYVKKINRNIDEILNSGNNNWQEIQIEFEKIRPHFFKSLTLRCPNLTVNDLKHCYYIVTGLSSSEVAELISLTVRSVETSRYRIKRKLKLSREVSLFDFLNRF
ncbi:MAG: PAS domain S-box protein [Flavobacteriales bacterium]